MEFLNSPCMAVPATASAQPTSAAAITRGSLTSRMIIPAVSELKSDAIETLVGPTATARTMLARRTQMSIGIAINLVLDILC